jgi:hypothetical protein
MQLDDCVAKIDVIEENLKQYAFDKVAVFAKFKKEKDGRVYIGKTYSSLKEAVLDRSPLDKRVNSRNVFYIEKWASVEISKTECAVLLTEDLVKKLSKII